MDRSIPSRASNDAATSRGLRIGKTTTGARPKFSDASSHTGNRRQSLGSFNTHSEAEPNSSRSVASARLRKLFAMRVASQSASKGLQSSHPQPAEASICSSSLMTTLDSQTVESVVLGKLHPNKLKVRVNTEV